jgi:hypothetical protein
MFCTNTANQINTEKRRTLVNDIIASKSKISITIDDDSMMISMTLRARKQH